MRTMGLVLAASLVSGISAMGRAPTLLIYGGPDNKIFLGCLNCSEHDANSVHNEFGVYGSRYSLTSIVNRFGEYGSRSSGYSACNASTLQAPVIVDEQGTFYGRLTVNPAATDRLQDEATRAWLAGVCEAT